MTAGPKLGCHVQTWGAVRLRAAGAGSVAGLQFESCAPFHRALTDIRLAGFDGVEVFDGDLAAWDAAGLRVADAGLELSGVYVGGYLIYDDLWPEERERIRRSAALAAAHGAVNIVLGVGAVHADGVRPGDLQRIAERLVKLVDDARAEGVVAHYHPHPGAGGHTPTDVETILDAAPVGICPDTAVLAAGGVDPLALVRRHLARIDYAHLKDSFCGVDVEVGAGDLPLLNIVAALAGRGSAWLITELDASHTDPGTSARFMATFVRRALAAGREAEEATS